MKKTVKIDSKTKFELSNNVKWLIIYRDQFGRDIVPTIVPALNAGLELIFSLYKATGGRITKDVINEIDFDDLTGAIYSMSGVEAVDLLNICWAMAKNADDALPDPADWLEQFDTFPLDIIAPAVFEMLYKGFISGKNLKRLQDVLEGLKPLTSTK